MVQMTAPMVAKSLKVEGVAALATFRDRDSGQWLAKTRRSVLLAHYTDAVRRAAITMVVTDWDRLGK